MTRPVQIYPAESLRVGLAARYERAVGEADVRAFAENSGDVNPLHVDAVYATTTRYGRPIAHGAFQVGLASALIGVELPGRNVLLSAIHARFPAPLYFPTRVAVQGEITAWNGGSQAGRIRVVVTDLARHTPTAEIEFDFTLHETASVPPPEAAPKAPARHDAADRKSVLVTGASGGIGAALTGALAGPYRVLAQVNRTPLPRALGEHPDVRVVALDFASPIWAPALAEAIAADPLYAVVHTAWPGLPHGSLLDMEPETVAAQLHFGSTLPIRLARLLRDSLDTGQGGRMIVLGSTAGTRNPVLALGAYSLGKVVLEQTVRLLAPELARKNITVNAICPSFTPLGMNKTANERQVRLESAQTPLGRVCEAEDIAGAVSFLLSPAAGYISGEVIHLTGGRLP